MQKGKSGLGAAAEKKEASFVAHVLLLGVLARDILLDVPALQPDGKVCFDGGDIENQVVPAERSSPSVTFLRIFFFSFPSHC